MPPIRRSFDVVVVGNSSAGVAAALSAARTGRALRQRLSVALVYNHPRTTGGMLTNGVCSTDIRPPYSTTIPNGLFREFIDRVAKHYRRSRPDTTGVDMARFEEGLIYEPEVAFAVVRAMLAEESDVEGIAGMVVHRALTDGRRVVGVRFRRRKQGDLVDVMAPVIIDATVEGDVLASAGEEGTDWVVGRESVRALKGRTDVHPVTRRRGEPHAGRIIVYPRTQQRNGGDGTGDKRSQSFNNRVTAQRNGWVPEGWPGQPPTGYRENRPFYEMMLRPPVAWGRAAPHLGVPAGRWVQQVLPNGKLDLNLDPIGMNQGYVKGSQAERRAIAARIRNFELGFLYHLRYVLGHSRLGLSNDYPDSWPGIHKLPMPHYPPELYVREGRRMVGEYVLSEWDGRRATRGLRPEPSRRRDIVAIGEYPMDSHCVTGVLLAESQKFGARVCEGAFWLSVTAPFQVPYGAILPNRLDGLLVPVAASATHVGYSALRMEPVRMALGQAAGTAAALAVHLSRSPRRVPIALLQYRLARQGQMLRYWSDVTWYSRHRSAHPPNRRDFAALQLLGGRNLLLGSAGNYQVHPHAAVSGSQLTDLLARLGRRPSGLDKRRQVSRSRFAREVVAALKLSERRSARPTFTDVGLAHPSYGAVEALVSRGYIRPSKSEPKFNPDGKTTRAFAARVLARHIFGSAD
jgi:FAD dependent oxidoreductase/S-layer homology domain